MTIVVAGLIATRLDAAELLAEVVEGVKGINEVRVKPSQPAIKGRAAA